MRSDAGRPGEDRDDRRIDRVLGWIHRQMAREITVAEAARVAGVTPGAFSRFFRHEVGKTFTQYINDVRCSEAGLLLRRTDKAVTIVAQECGFATMSHFNRQFRIRHGVTPREFRRHG
jgi:AraC-like DNA-binding protein